MSNRRQFVLVNAAHRATMWPSFGGKKAKPGVSPRVSVSFDNKSLFFGLFGFGFRLVAGPLLERRTENIAK